MISGCAHIHACEWVSTNMNSLHSVMCRNYLYTQESEIYLDIQLDIWVTGTFMVVLIV